MIEQIDGQFVLNEFEHEALERELIEVFGYNKTVSFYELLSYIFRYYSGKRELYFVECIKLAYEADDILRRLREKK